MHGERAEFNFGMTLGSGVSGLAEKESSVDRDSWMRKNEGHSKQRAKPNQRRRGVEERLQSGSKEQPWYCRLKERIHDVSCSSVTESCSTLCDLMNCSTPGFPVLHHLPEFTQTHVH